MKIKEINNLLNSDCGCQKTANYNNNESWSPFFLCKILNIIFDSIFLLAIKTSYYNKIITRILVGILETMIGLAIIFNCDWHPHFPLIKYFTNSKQLLSGLNLSVLIFYRFFE